MTVRPPLDIRPWDRYRCHGCERDLPVDGAGRFSDEAISGCEGACDWELLGRGSRPGGTVSSDPDGAVSP